MFSKKKLDKFVNNRVLEKFSYISTYTSGRPENNVTL